ncbi:MAG: alpha-glucan family phosphorylase [Patescibacteria group bacterium]
MIIKKDYSVAYISMEIALENNIKTYAGGLGVLAGDLLKSAASQKFPVVGITLLNKEGYFKQKIDAHGNQTEMADTDFNFNLLTKLDTVINLNIGSEELKVGVWEYLISGEDGYVGPVYFLDADLPENKTDFRNLTSRLYGGDLENRLRQEIILGRGGIKILHALGYENIEKYHINEGHGALATVELFLQRYEKTEKAKIEAVKKLCVFTTHTPLKTVYDDFPLDLILQNQKDFPVGLKGLIKNRELNTLDLGMYFSGFINGVSKRHQELLKNTFPNQKIEAITNGVNSVFWTGPEFRKLFDDNLSGWRENNGLLKQAEKIPDEEIWAAHQKAKQRLLDYVKEKTQIEWAPEVFTLGYARRFTKYKQPLLLFTDIERLLEVLEKGREMQIVLAGKAHRRDTSGQEAIKKIFALKAKYPQLNIVFLENYDLNLAKLLVSAVDLWLNTPEPPLEACGTSGMKASHNGVPQFSTLDGWWPEGYVKNKTGWAINDSDDLYETLKKEILPLYYEAPDKWQALMKNVISINASYFNSDRAWDEYVSRAYKQ